MGLAAPFPSLQSPAQARALRSRHPADNPALTKPITSGTIMTQLRFAPTAVHLHLRTPFGFQLESTFTFTGMRMIVQKQNT
jgi:hypothetical protein